jgi:hypothetical protein
VTENTGNRAKQGTFQSIQNMGNPKKVIKNGITHVKKAWKAHKSKKIDGISHRVYIGLASEGKTQAPPQSDRATRRG